jgi:hypothetical protein
MQGADRTLQQIAFAYVMLPSGRMRQMYMHEMISLAREACDQLGIAYSNGACKPFEAAARASNSFPANSGQNTGTFELENAKPFVARPKRRLRKRR